MKKLLLIVSLVFLSVHLYAERVDENTALKVANTIVKDAKFDVMATRSYSNFYIFSSENSFVIVAADDRVKPIIGYSDSNPFVLNENMTNVNYWLGKVNNEIQYVVDNDIKATEEIENEWKTLLAGNSLAPKSRATVEPLLTTKWNQGAPFNNMCPTYGSERTVTGCVATAMAQIMNYWEWPKTGTGSHSYTSTAISSTHNVNFASTTYDWANMKDTYNSYTTTEANAVATLMYHVGVSVDMNYNVSSAGGSGAYSNWVPDALTTYFDYNPEITNVIKYHIDGYDYEYWYHHKNNNLTPIPDFTDEDWVTSIKTELNNERPVYYSGSGDGGGHAFVCDGYDASDNFHFNWGWGGSCDGYYPIGSLNPGTGGIGSGTVGEFNDQNFIILGFEPNPANYVADAYTFVGEGSWNTPSNWEGLDGNTLTTLPDFSTQKVVIKGNAVIGNEIEAVVANLEIKSSGTLTIQDGGSLTVNEEATNTKYDALIIEEGAQVFVNNEDVAATFKKSISNPDTWATDHDKGWQFIASPLKNADIANFVPSTGDYDLFKYDGGDTEDLQWQNHKDYGGNALTEFTYDFNTGFDGWTTIDGNSDGYTFFHSDESETYLGLSLDGTIPDGCIVGESYNNISPYSNLYPNDYLVAPQRFHIVEGSKISFDVAALTEDYAEQFGVAISTAANPTASDFNTVIGWELSGAGSWYLCEQDFNAYVGQDIWIAIHHFTATPQWFFIIDNITIKAADHDFEESFQQGRGYLASYETETTANIKGYIPTETSFNFPLTYNADNRWSNFHLLGNPFSFDIKWKDFAKTGVYNGIARMTTEGTYKYDATSDIKVGEGFMVMTNGTSPSLTYGTRAYNESYDNISVVASGVEGSDNVVLHFNGEENEGFPKLDNINENAANVFVLRNGNRYGICSYDEDVTEIPLYFDAKEMGSYSLAIETEGRFDNVYLYDKMTNETIDMLAEGEYRFTSTADENPNRFVIRFNRDNDNITSDNFVYQSEDNLYVNAEGTIQIIDVMGRIVYSSDVENDNNVINVSHLNKATYFVRNINENQVRIQKIVIL